MRDKRPPRMIQNVFVLLLLAVFAAMSTLLVTLGAQVYRGTVERANANNEARILSAVVRTDTWTEDGQAVFSVEEYDGIKVLCIENVYDGEVYAKRLFCYAGELRESFANKEYPFSPDSGERICKAESFEPVLDGGLLTVTLKGENGGTRTVQVNLRSACAAEE